MEHKEPRKYVIVDVETSGGHPFETRVTEISIQVSNGKDLIASYTTLINPTVKIPPYVRRLTGITNEMTDSAPKFRQVAKEIYKFVNEAVFVAHNVAFDYNVLKSEFKRIGIDWEAERLCTVKASRRIFPEKKSYSLGNLSQELNITIENRHRAEGDARATLELFHMLMESNSSMLLETVSAETKDFLLYEKYSHLKLHTVPNKTGYVTIHNSKGEIVYAKSGTSLKKLVMSYIKHADKTNPENDIAEIKCTLTGSPLLAKILEKEHRAKNKEQNKEAAELAPNKKFSNKSFVVIDKGPDAEHKTVMLVLQGKLVSYGIVRTQERIKDVQKLAKTLGKAIHPENAEIITSYLSQHKVEKLEFIREKKD